MSLQVFAREAVIYAIGNIGLRAASVLLTPVYTYYLTVGDYGLWATIQTTIQIMVILMTVGMREALMRYSKDYENQPGKLIGTTMFTIFLGVVSVTILSLTILAPFFRNVMHRDDVGELIALTCGASCAHAMSIHIMSYYRTTNQASRYMISGIGGALLLFVITLGSLVGLHLGVRGVLWSYILAYAIIFVVVGGDVLRRTGASVSSSMMAKLVRFGAPLIFSTAGQFGVVGASIYLLSYFAGLEVVAIYSLGYRLVTLLSIAVALPFQLAFQPFVFSNLKNPDIRTQTARLFTYLLLATTCATFLLLLGSRVLLPLIAPPQYAPAFLVVLFLVPSQALIGVHYFGETLFGAVQKTEILAALSLLSVAVCVGLNLALIPVLGWYGAAIASTATAVLINLTELAIGIRYFQLAQVMEWRRVGIAVGLFVTLLVVLFALHAASLVVFCGGAIMVLLVYLMILYFGPFCHDSERAAIKSAADLLRMRLLPGKSAP